MTPTTEHLAAIARRRLALVHPGVPEEGPAEHVRNALALLVAHENAHPAVWTFSPELRACEARLFKALYEIEGAR
jgi:hypothetical protein